MKASPAPSTLYTSTGKPGPLTPSSSRSGMSPGNTTQPIGPRLQTMVAAVTARTARMAASVSSDPPAIISSSSVPTIRSHSGRTGASSAVTPSDRI